MDVRDEALVPGIAACIGEPARARMLYCLLDGRARTSTELGLVGGVSASTASVHLARLKQHRLVRVLAQGKHRYYSLANPDVAGALEALSVIAGARIPFKSTTPDRLRESRTCYDHMAGATAVALHARLLALRWLVPETGKLQAYQLTPAGVQGLSKLGVDVPALRERRRRFAFACVDWSERRPHLGGALGAGLLELAIAKRWAVREREGRCLTITAMGRRCLQLPP
jgi:DNA-binding transcriptional ArsR family regulator